MSKLHDELWEKYRHPLAGHEWLLGTQYAGFTAALDEAMEMQRRACAEAIGDDGLQLASTDSAIVHAILNAKVEET